MTIDQAKGMINRLKDLPIPDPACTVCETLSYTRAAAVTGRLPAGATTVSRLPPGFENCPDKAGYVRPCADCKTRVPYAWLARLTPESIVEWSDRTKHLGDCFEIIELKVLLPKRGFEFL